MQTIVGLLAGFLGDNLGVTERSEMKAAVMISLIGAIVWAVVVRRVLDKRTSPLWTLAAMTSGCWGWSLFAMFYIGNYAQAPTLAVGLEDLPNDGFFRSIPPDSEFVLRGIEIREDLPAIVGLLPFQNRKDFFTLKIGSILRNENGLSAVVCLAGYLEGVDYNSHSLVTLKRGSIFGPLFGSELGGSGSYEFFLAVEDESLNNQSISVSIVRRRVAPGLLYRKAKNVIVDGGCPLKLSDPPNDPCSISGAVCGATEAKPQ